MEPLAPWLQRSLETAVEVCDESRLHHAFLVDAQPGWGADNFCAAWSSRLLGIQGDPRETAHPDILWLKPEGASLKIDQMRELIDFVYRSVQVAERKVAVIDGVETATIAASNAILKSLEEPPPNAHLILLTHAIDLLLPTIRSRCQRVALAAATETECRAWLLENGMTESEIEDLLVEYGNAPYSILNAWQQKVTPLRSRLLEVWNQPRRTLHLAGELRNAEIDELLVRWMRLTERFARSGRNYRVHLFWDDLVAARRSFNNVGSLNKQLQIERLLIRWSELR